ncbi:MAG: hypothetical protein WDN75_14365 [Bacteroidota bacterium]
MKERERLKRVPLDSLLLFALTARIDSISFEKTKFLNTENAYQHFIDHHGAAKQIPSAIELRDEVAFLEALKSNTWSGFQKFIMKYPASLRYNEAQNRYEKLLYEDKTSNHKLTSYIKFHQQFPKSPYKSLAERNILSMATASGSPESFQWFIRNYPLSGSAAVAKNILYKLQLTDDDDIFDDTWMTDSLRTIEKLNASYWVPVIKSGKYGFIDDQGVEVIAPSFEMIAEDYHCGDIRDRLLVTSAGLIARNGKQVLQTGVDDAKEIGLGYWFITSDSVKYVIHESGFRIGTAAEGALVLANRFIGLKKNKKWSLFSLTGSQLVNFLYDEVTAFDSLIVLTKGGKKVLTTPSRIGKVSSTSVLTEDLVFDDVKRWGPQQYWVRNGWLKALSMRTWILLFRWTANSSGKLPLDLSTAGTTRSSSKGSSNSRIPLIKRLTNRRGGSVFKRLMIVTCCLIRDSVEC